MALGFSFHISLFLYHFQMNLKICKQDYFVSRFREDQNPYYIIHYIELCTSKSTKLINLKEVMINLA